MRALPALVAVAAGLAIVSSAAAQPAVSDPVANGRDANAAYLEAPGQLVIDSGGEALRVSVPQDCVPGAVRGIEVALNCGVPGQESVQLFNADNGAIVPVPLSVPRGYRYQALQLGRRWSLVLTSSTVNPTSSSVRKNLFLVGRDGTSVNLANDPFGPRRVLDLDARSGARRLCKPARRHAIPDLNNRARFAISGLFGRWFFERTGSGPSVTNCKSGKQRDYSREFSTVVNDRVAAYNIEGAIRIRSLRTNRLLRTISWQGASAERSLPVLTLTSNRIFARFADGSVASFTFRAQ